MSEESGLYELKGAEYLLDDYCTLGDSQPLTRNGVRYTLQRYQGAHNNEFTLRSETGTVYLFENNILKQKWQENEKGVKSETFLAFKNGVAHFSQHFKEIIQQKDFYRIINHKRGLRLEVTSINTDFLMYHGEFNDKHQKDGWGIEYDEESGSIVLEGIWSNGKLKEVIRCFNGNVMTELKRNGADSLDPTKRIPIYTGGFRYDEDSETFIREGKGYLIDVELGIAKREGEWKDGKEMRGTDLYEGWYDPKSRLAFTESPLPKPYSNLRYVRPLAKPATPKGLDNLSLTIKDMTISSNSYNDVDLFDIGKFKSLKTVQIGDDCFQSVKTFKIEELSQLKSVKIGSHSFTEAEKSFLNAAHTFEEWKKINNGSKSFHITKCQSLESIEIGPNSFSDFGGEFELANCSALQSIKIGQVDKDSNNFLWSSFVVKDLPNLKSISLGAYAFSQSLTTIIKDLRSLQSIELGWYSLFGRHGDLDCKLEMRNLPNLISIINIIGYSFCCTRSVTLENINVIDLDIPNVQIVSLPISFFEVQSKSFSNVSSLLSKRADKKGYA